jgi:hypothetical protein
MSLSFYSTILVVLIYSPSFFLFIKYNIIDEIENETNYKFLDKELVNVIAGFLFTFTSILILYLEKINYLN